ncbi:tight adherence protein TadE [Sphingobium sp. SYK-6]|uniref:TadE/TadG family type IV pilus assembly protein n=1 Tax=Sphingobium sp. (strain NBRC 103272 / SYK-6) TaxID=627192 RepID=UPI00022773E5|nr:TadE/TadG family type IV pilus assembly protein [Sphingobium sp. SYK-6]BAK67073.1 tight adherence protein TadE [Sphingobium sp. SYK-6]
MMLRLRHDIARLKGDRNGLAAVEFALSAPVILTMFLAGAELTNFAITKMRVSQVALHIADNASRIGTNSLLTAPQISEAQINDLLIGANLQAGKLQLATRGRVIVSSLEPIANPNPTGKFRIRWQRCYGTKSHPSSYGLQGDTNLTGMGPSGQHVTAPDGGGVIFVEVAYDYEPLISDRFLPSSQIRDIAAMTVRDDRDFGGNGEIGIYNSEGVTPSTC